MMAYQAYMHCLKNQTRLTPMKKFLLTPEEKQTRQLSQYHLEAMLQAMKEDGLMVIRGAVDPDHVAVVREGMLADLAKILKAQKTAENFTAGHLQQDPSPFPEFLFPDILFNPYAAAITRAIMGPETKLSTYSGNTNMPGSENQPVHADVPQLWADLERATPPFGIVINITVVPTSARNGGTEVWPGTHLDTSHNFNEEEIKIDADSCEAQRKITPPLQPEMEPGDLLLRDIRLWHRGMTNPSSEPRPMIGLIHWINWWPSPAIAFPEKSRSFVEKHANVKMPAAYHPDEEINYLFHHQSYDR